MDENDFPKDIGERFQNPAASGAYPGYERGGAHQACFACFIIIKKYLIYKFIMNLSDLRRSYLKQIKDCKSCGN